MSKLKQGIKRKGPYINLTEKLDRIDYCNGTMIKTMSRESVIDLLTTDSKKELDKYFLFDSQQILFGCSNLGCTQCSCIHFRKSIYKNTIY